MFCFSLAGCTATIPKHIGIFFKKKEEKTPCVTETTTAYVERHGYSTMVGKEVKCINVRIFFLDPPITWSYETIYSPHYRFLLLGFGYTWGIYMVALRKRHLHRYIV